jgi:hypothetical protein
LVRFLVRYFLQMGLGSSKFDVPTITTPVSDSSSVKEAAFVPLATAEAKEAELAGQIEATRQQAQEKLEDIGSQLSGALGSIFRWKILFGIAGILVLVFGILFIYDYFAIKNGWQTALLPAPPQAPAPPPGGGGGEKATAPKVGTNPPLFSKFTSFVTGSDSSGDLLSSLHDATTSMSIPATSAPLSNQSQGAYGVQWWMFVKDWNYGYGKDKSVLVRPDATNTSVMNPSISLHPTDNTLKVSISVFPTGNNASKTEPAPATGSGASTDDVFVCEIPNIPLQAWFSVSVTVFGKNADIYIDGKLVKSCMLPGVPKPAVGDIQISPNGGFSGYVCNVYHYPRMLTPSDAMTFYSAGSSCSKDVSSSGVSSSSLSGYSIKFGMYDTLGKQVQQYTF